MPQPSRSIKTRRSPDQFDVALGHRIKVERKSRGISQELLANRIGVSFQQLQKYERGKNRISPSRLSAIADILEMPVSIFFEAGSDGRKQAQAGESSPLEWLAVDGAVRLLRAYIAIPDGRLRQKAVLLFEQIAKRYKARLNS
jgi:transcriptional regulator with XRE-family HTH domain